MTDSSVLLVPTRVGVLIAALMGSTACRTPAAPLPPTHEWVRLDPGIALQAWERTEPRRMRIYAATIDLDDSRLEVRITPGNGDRRRDVDGMKTSRFARANDCEIAFNASPYWPVFQHPGSPKNVRGIAKADGHLYSPPEESYATLAFSDDGGATILDADIGAAEVAPFPNAVGGFDVILRDGVDVSHHAEHVTGVHPRVAVGTSEDGKTLFLLVVDGRQPGYSEGASLSELASLLIELGADDGLNLDGGGSTTLVGRSGRRWAYLNRPAHGLRPGTERVVATHVCIRSTPE